MRRESSIPGANPSRPRRWRATRYGPSSGDPGSSRGLYGGNNVPGRIGPFQPLGDEKDLKDEGETLEEFRERLKVTGDPRFWLLARAVSTLLAPGYGGWNYVDSGSLRSLLVTVLELRLERVPVGWPV